MLLPYLNKDLIEAGCDEAGRGCLAGSVYAAAVILPKDFKNELLNDSKQLTEKQRYALREVIEKEALAWAVGVVSPERDREIKHSPRLLSGDAPGCRPALCPSSAFADRRKTVSINILTFLILP